MSETAKADAMTWREKLVCRILLILAGMVAPSEAKDEIKHLDNHIRLMRGGRD